MENQIVQIPVFLALREFDLTEKSVRVPKMIIAEQNHWDSEDDFDKIFINKKLTDSILFN